MLMNEAATMDLPATPPRSLESKVISVTLYNTPTAAKRLFSDGRVIEVSTRQGRSRCAVATVSKLRRRSRDLVLHAAVRFLACALEACIDFDGGFDGGFDR